MPFIATLSGMLVASGTGLLLAHNQSVSVSYDTDFTWLGQGDFLGFPTPAWIAAAAYVYGSVRSTSPASDATCWLSAATRKRRA